MASEQLFPEQELERADDGLASIMFVRFYRMRAKQTNTSLAWSWPDKFSWIRQVWTRGAYHGHELLAPVSSGIGVEDISFESWVRRPGKVDLTNLCKGLFF